jgi:1,2-diacylglycerol 3-beta-galactosyltransferase
VGRYSTDPKAIAAQVAQWVGPAADELASMAIAAKALGRPNATFRIVRDLAALTKAAV